MFLNKKAAFTLVELLVVIAIIGILISLLLPAIQAARESARRMACTHNLMNLGVALNEYESAQGSLPSGVEDDKGPIRNIAAGKHYSWITKILPYIEEKPLYQKIDFKSGVYDAKNAQVRMIPLRIVSCPSSPHDEYTRNEEERFFRSMYAGCTGGVETPIDSKNDGVLFLNSHIKREDVTDGVSHTLYVGEKICDLNDLGWMSGTRATLRNTDHAKITFDPNRTLEMVAKVWPKPDAEVYADSGEETKTPEAPKPDETKKPEVNSKTDQMDLYVGGFGSSHPTVSNFLFGDGNVQAIVHNIDEKVFQMLGNRADGAVSADDPTRAQQ